MYEFSRRLYRDLSPMICDRAVCFDGESNHEHVLHACEAAVERLATDRLYFARPSKALFKEIRVFFTIGEQRRVHEIVRRHLAAACAHFESLPLTGFDANGNRLVCRATTRRGTACQRMPLAHNGYCPSHQHLADTEEVALAA
jgi:hypothetical protein